MNKIAGLREEIQYFHGPESAGQFNEHFSIIQQQAKDVFIITDKICLELCLPQLIEISPAFKEAKVITISEYEENKNLETCQYIWEQLTNFQADRDAIVVNLGGGYVCDIGGFCAATFKRGLSFVNIPTTLLAQVDASIGGKTGVNFLGHKNLIGVFSFPKAVLIHASFLKTLGDRQLKSGLAEILKHALIANDAYWKTIISSDLMDVESLGKLVGPSLTIKEQLINEDPLDRGRRKILNYGHTIGHAIEGYSMESGSPLFHGEAVAIGMICESYLSYKYAGLEHDALDEICSVILQIFPPYALDTEAYHRLIQLMKNDKKNRNQEINFTLLKRIGEATFDQHVKADAIIDALQFYGEKIALMSKA